MPPTILVTNDDGIDSQFLRVLVEGLRAGGFAPVVAAPTEERSWVSRALSRWRDVQLTQRDDFGCPAWALDGTPTDCVNIALGHLLTERPAAVVSGINLRENVSLPYILSSGTVAGALEGALWGLPALAFSLEIPDGRAAEVRAARGHIGGGLGESLRCAGARAADFLRQALAEAPATSPRVHNINFPAITTPVTPVARTRPGRVRLGALFTRESPRHFRFHHHDPHEAETHADADHAALARGCISHTVLDYGVLGAELGARPPAP
jgi:5'-nucleotidase